MEIKASSKYDWNTIKSFNIFNRFKRTALKRVMTIILAIAIILTLLIFAAAIAMDSFDDTLRTLFIAELAIVAVYFFGAFLLPKLIFNLDKIKKNAENHYVFKEKSFVASNEIQGIKSNSEIDYYILHSVYETSGYFYIYISSRKAFIVDKEKIEDGKQNELRCLLAAAVGNEKFRYMPECK